MTTDIITKICTGECKQDKPITDFYKNPRNKSGWHNQCKQCIADHNAMNAEHNRLRTRRWERENPEKKAAYVESHREQHAATSLAWYNRNREAVSIRRKAERASHPEIHRERVRKYSEANGDEIRKRARDRYKENKKDNVWYQRRLRKNREWRDANRERYNEYYRDYYHNFIKNKTDNA